MHHAGLVLGELETDGGDAGRPRKARPQGAVTVRARRPTRLRLGGGGLELNEELEVE